MTSSRRRDYVPAALAEGIPATTKRIRVGISRFARNRGNHAQSTEIAGGYSQEGNKCSALGEAPVADDGMIKSATQWIDAAGNPTDDPILAFDVDARKHRDVVDDEDDREAAFKEWRRS